MTKAAPSYACNRHGRRVVDLRAGMDKVNSHPFTAGTTPSPSYILFSHLPLSYLLF